MTKRKNRILIAVMVLVAVGMAIQPSAAATPTTPTINATFPWYDSSAIANNTHNLTIGFNTTNNDTASLLWQINITNPGSYDYQWVTIDVWNGTDWVNAGATNNTTFYANSSNIANATVWTHGFNDGNSSNYSAVIALRTTNSTVSLGGFTINVSNVGNMSEWATLSELNFTANVTLSTANYTAISSTDNTTTGANLTFQFNTTNSTDLYFINVSDTNVCVNGTSGGNGTITGNGTFTLNSSYSTGYISVTVSNANHAAENATVTGIKFVHPNVINTSANTSVYYNNGTIPTSDPTTTIYYFFNDSSINITIRTHARMSNVTASCNNITNMSCYNASGVNDSGIWMYNLSASDVSAGNETDHNVTVNLTFNGYTTTVNYPFVALMNFNPIYMDGMNLAGNTTNWETEIADFTSVSGLTFEKFSGGNSLGELKFWAAMNLTNLTTAMALKNLGQNMVINRSDMVLNSDTLTAMNVSSNLTMYNLTFSESPAIFSGGVVSVNATEDSGGAVANLSYTGTTLTFNVTHWTDYTVYGLENMSESATANVSTSDCNFTMRLVADAGKIFAIKANVTCHVDGNSVNATTSHNVTVGAGNSVTFNVTCATYGTVWVNATNGSTVLNNTNVVFVNETIPPVVNTVELNTTAPPANGSIVVEVNVTDNVYVASVTAEGVALTRQSGDMWNGTINASWVAGTAVIVNVSATDSVGNVGHNNSTSYTPIAADPASMINVSGTGQTGSVSTALTYPIVFQVNDTYNNPVPNVAVNFTNTSDSAIDKPNGTTTDASGQVQVNLTLGSSATTYGVTCIVADNPDINNTVTAEAVNLMIGYNGTGLITGRGNNSARVDVQTSLDFSFNASDASGGDANLTSLNITFPDGFSLPAGLNDSANLTLSGFNANITASNVTLIGTNVLKITNSTGGCIWNTTQSTYFSINLTNTSNFTMPLTVGSYTIEVNVTSSAATVTGGIALTMTVGESYNVTNVSGTGQSGTVGLPLSNPFVFQLNDIGGNAISGVAMNFTVNCTTGSFSTTNGTLTNSSGQVSGTLTLGTTAGTYRVICEVAGTPIINNSIAATATAGTFDHINVTPTSASLNVSIGAPTEVFTATGYDQYNNEKSGLNFTWASSDTYAGTIAWTSTTTGTFTAAHVGTSDITASNGTKTSDPVPVTVSAGSNNTTVTDVKTFTATSGDDVTVTGSFTSNVTGWVNATAIGNATASPEVNQSNPRDGLGSSLKMVSGVTVNVSSNITDELAAGNGTIRIQICYNAATLTALNIDASTLAIYKYNSTTGWAQQTSTVSGSCVYADVTHLCTFGAFGYKTTTTDDGNGGSSGGQSTYPSSSGGFALPAATATPTATATPAATATAVKTAKPATPAKPAAGTTPAAGDEATPEKPEKKGLLPGFEGVFAIAGLLAISYVMMRRKR